MPQVIVKILHPHLTAIECLRAESFSSSLRPQEGVHLKVAEPS